MPHSYGADFSGEGLLGPRTWDSTTEISAKPAPSAIMRRMESQPCIDVGRLVNDFPSQSLMLTQRVVIGRWSLVVAPQSLVVRRPCWLDLRLRLSTNDQRPMTD